MSEADPTAPDETPTRRDEPKADCLPVDLAERFKAACWATRNEPDPDDTGPMGAKVERLLDAECRRLEEVCNGGALFPPAPKRARGMSVEGLQRQRVHMETDWDRQRDRDASA